MCDPVSDLDDVVSAEHATSVASVTMFSDGALHLKEAGVELSRYRKMKEAPNGVVGPQTSSSTDWYSLSSGARSIRMVPWLAQWNVR